MGQADDSAAFNLGGDQGSSDRWRNGRGVAMAHPQALFHRAATLYARLVICPIAPGVPRCRTLVLVTTNSGQPGVRNGSRECEGTRQVQPYEGTSTHINLSPRTTANALGPWLVGSKNQNLECSF